MRPALLLVVLLAACGPGSYREFRDELVGAACAWAERCGRVVPGDRAHCGTDEVLAIFHDSTAERAVVGAIDVAAAIEAGRMRYDRVNAADCLDAVRDAPCEPTLAARVRRRACNAVVAARTETDRACWADVECTGGVCARPSGCAGVCAAYASFGLPCVEDAMAPAAMRCDPTVAYCAPRAPDEAPVCLQKKPEGKECGDTRECSFDWTCRLGVCTAPVELGEHEACGGTEACEAGLYCQPATGTCQPQRLQMEACDSRYGCEDGLACIGLGVGDGAGQPGVCTPWLQMGAPCIGDDAEVVTGCPPGSSVCSGGRCMPIDPRAGAGDDCSQRACAEGLACSAIKRCDHLLAIFGDCSGDRASLCASGLVCRSDAPDSFDRPGLCLPEVVDACFQPVRE